MFVALEDGGLVRPHTHAAPPLSGSPETVAEGLGAFAAAGVDEAILVVSPITEPTIRTLGQTIAGA